MTIIELLSSHGQLRIAQQGAQVLDAQLGGQPLLWCSPLAKFEAGQPIRGGVPLCFPWFGKAAQPAHGFARILPWQLLEQGPASARFRLSQNPATMALWPYQFAAELTVTLDQAIHFNWQVDNLDQQSFTFSYALHSYFAVSDVRQCQVAGLAGCTGHVLGQPPLLPDGPLDLAEPIDVSFEHAPSALSLLDGRRTIQIDAHNMASAVVWNAGPAALEIADIGKHWTDYICVERGNLGAASITLAPGERHQANMRISCE